VRQELVQVLRGQQERLRQGPVQVLRGQQKRVREQVLKQRPV